MNNFYIGLMSGTSADGIDAALVDLKDSPRLLDHFSLPLPTDIRRQILQLNTSGPGELDLAGELDCRMGELFAQATLALMHQAGVNAQNVRAIGSHGQTIRHRPPSTNKRGFSWQIGDPNVIAQRTGITTVADFRRRDMAAGGQGAPLVPAFHKALFHHPECNRILINIGGIANITWLGRDGQVTGFDTGPGNCLMDSWIERHRLERFDRDGAWAAEGLAHKPLIEALLSHDYFALTPPKSTGREEFHLAWLDIQLQSQPALAPEDVQASLLELSALSISQSIQPLIAGTDAEIFVCGGGAYNQQLMRRLQACLPDHSVVTTQSLGIAPDWIESMAFAWLAQQTLEGKCGNLCAVTGAQQAVILGGIYPGQAGWAN